MPVWLGQAPSGTGWRYMHEDGRVEDLDPTAMGMPPGWAPPGFESSAPQPDMGAQPNLGVAPLEAPQVDAPPPPAPVAPVAQSQSVSSSFKGATLPVQGSPGASDAISRRAAGQAGQQAGAYAPVFDAQAAALQGGAQSQALQSEAQQQGLEREAALMRSQQEGRAREVQEIHAKATDWTGQIQQAMNSIPTIDANKLFHDANSYQSAALGISAFMGGFLQPVLGTNAPMDIINKAIDRSILQQQNAQNMAQQDVANVSALAERDQDAALWELNQNDLARAGHITALQREVAATVQGYQSDIFRKQGEKLLADFEKAKLDTYQNIFTNTRTYLEQQRHSMRVESIQSQELAMRKAEAEAKAKGDKGEDRSIRDPATGKVVGYLRGGTVGQVSEYNAKQAGAYSTSRRLLELNKLVKDNGSLWKKSNWGSTEEAQELRGVYNDLLSDIIKSKTGATATPQEYERLEKVLPFPGKINPDSFKNIANYVEKITNDQNTLNTTSLDPLEGEETLGFDFRKSVDKLRAEHSTADIDTPVDSMHGATLELEAARTPVEAQTAVLKIVRAAESSAAVDSGRAAISQAIQQLRALPPEVRSLPGVDGDSDPVTYLESLLSQGSAQEAVQNLTDSLPPPEGSPDLSTGWHGGR